MCFEHIESILPVALYILACFIITLLPIIYLQCPLQKVLAASNPSDTAKALIGPNGAGLCLALFACTKYAASSHQLAPELAAAIRGPRIKKVKQQQQEKEGHESLAAAPATAPPNVKKLVKAYNELTVGQHELEIDVRGGISVRSLRSQFMSAFL